MNQSNNQPIKQSIINKRKAEIKNNVPMIKERKRDYEKENYIFNKNLDNLKYVLSQMIDDDKNIKKLDKYKMIDYINDNNLNFKTIKERMKEF